jgi:hypothetical protein
MESGKSSSYNALGFLVNQVSWSGVIHRYSAIMDIAAKRLA